MTRCPITLAELRDDETRYSKAGLRSLSAKLSELQVFEYSAEEQRLESMARMTKMSIQGVRAKLSARLRVKDARFEVVDRGGRYILKPQHYLFPFLPENEAITMRLAAAVGIEVPLHGLIESRDGSLTYFARRFDRVGRSGKLSVEDFAQLSNHTRQAKYGASMEQVAEVIERHCTFPMKEFSGLLRRTLFCFLVGNEEAHLKNFSLIRRDGLVELSPAYDLLNTTIAVPGVERPEEMALPLNGRTRGISKNDLLGYFGKDRLGLGQGEIDDIMDRFCKEVPSWEVELQKSFLPQEQRELYLELLAARRARLGI